MYKFGSVDRRVGSGRRRSTRMSLCSSGVVFERTLKPAMHILNKVFDSDITLLASFVTAVDNSSSFFVLFVHFKSTIFLIFFVYFAVAK